MEFIEVNGEDREIIKGILDLENNAFGDNGAIDIWTLKPFVRYGKVFALLENDVVVSAIEFIHKFDSKEIYLFGVSTREEFRGRGCAKKLMERSTQYFKEKGMEKISLTVAPENKSAVGLYKKMGYIIENIQNSEYGEGVDRLYMVKKII
ncbi:GNAT family N-acetyltransferase [Ilyobacter polytropus]|uniref:GCN5-related N-acetyltransferase n=1 Tax=Ilyobacter polytropus (strain ATCC 51220 / DSM 2926 / LMG 16218 / CuHBu1) TaxID=572544 RepID=E3H677_ILYPC|nr:N-acetyltransferase [Ilyobacter polytropus]ADO81836.1 GCN5-related N-acetyltransferase [Ilyobacter polytropus DSM 2926]